MKFKDIQNFIEGNFNHLLDRFNSLDDKTKAMAQARINICKNCPNLVENKCELCGCSWPGMVFSPQKNCDAGKW
jgi:hypothetical protein